MKHFTGKKNAITICVCLLFTVFVFANEIRSHNRAEALIRQHALIIADALWNVNLEGTAEYLRLATVTNRYGNLTVYDPAGSVLQSFSNASSSRLEEAFRRSGLTPEIRLTSPVLHQGRRIGSIEAAWHPPTIYTAIYVMVVLAMLTAVLHLYLRNLFDKAALEERVAARTRELAQSNRILLREIHQKRKTATILRKSEEEYRELYSKAKSAEEVYRSLIDSSADAILICNLNKQVRYLSSTFTALFGWKLDEVKGTVVQLFAPETRETASRIFDEISRLGASYQAYEIEAVTRENEPVDISLSGSRFNDHTGQPNGVLFVIRDISSRKRMEKQLKRAERLEAVGTLAGGIAHDFNNLLMGIQGNTSLAQLEAGANSQVIERLRAIESYIHNGQELTARLLGFARGGKYEVTPTDLNRLIREETQLFARTRKDITFQETFQENPWPVEVDRGQIRQVLLNLYVNAGQAMAGGGIIRVSTRNIELDQVYFGREEAPPGRFVQISVTDSGHGMDKKTMARIFDPFFTTKEIGHGTGLGLASAYGIVKNHNGFIDVCSEPGEGTTFTIHLPASDKAIGTEQSAEESLSPLQGQGTILLIDDEPMILEVGREMLKAIGYTAVTADSGRTAGELYRQDPDRFAAVILDMIMPDMDGGAVFRQLRQINPEVRVLLSSGYSLNDRAAEIMSQGCAGFLQKPFDINRLSAKLREVLQQPPAK